MDTFIKTLAGVLITLILYLILTKQNKDMSILLTLLACCMITVAAITYLKPVFTFFDKLEDLGKLDAEMIKILLKAVGIGLLAELTSLICADAGNAALGKTLQILASSAILWLSVPLFTSLIELVESILVFI